MVCYVDNRLGVSTRLCVLLVCVACVCVLSMFVWVSLPLIDWISHGITNWIYPDPDPFVSHPQNPGTIFLEKKKRLRQRRGSSRASRNMGAMPFFQNLKFPKSHVPAIQIELILS